MEIGPILRTMSHNKIGVGLLILEIAFTLAIAVNCFNLILEQKGKMDRPTGMDEDHILAVTTRPYGDAFSEREFRIQVIDRDLEMLRAMPGIVDASVISPYPLIGGGSSTQIKPLGAPDTQLVRSPVYYADTHVTSTLGIELMEGRLFTDADIPVERGPQPLNVLITKDLADALFPGESALGKQLDTGSEEFPDTVVGIVKHMQTPYDDGGPMETRITIFPSKPNGSSRMGYLVRTEPTAFNGTMARLPERLSALNKDRVIEVKPLAEFKGEAYVFNSIISRSLTAVIALLVFVTCIGIGGMTFFTVSRRTKQIGIRRALGAQKGDVLRYFLVENTLIALFGIGLGLVGAFVLNLQLVNRFGGTPLSPWLALGGAATIWVLGLLATYFPALKGAAIAPAVASRTV